MPAVLGQARRHSPSASDLHPKHYSTAILSPCPFLAQNHNSAVDVQILPTRRSRILFPHIHHSNLVPPKSFLHGSTEIRAMPYSITHTFPASLQAISFASLPLSFMKSQGSSSWFLMKTRQCARNCR